MLQITCGATSASSAILLAAVLLVREVLDVRDLVLQLLWRVTGESLEGVQDGSVAGAAANVAVDRLLDLSHR